LMGGRYFAVALGALTHGAVQSRDVGVSRQTTPLQLPLGKFAEGARIWLEEGVLERFITAVPRAVLKFAEGVYAWFEAGLLEWIINRLPRIVIDGATLLYRVVEQQGLEGALRSTAKGVFKFNRWVQNRHTGRLRANLRWVFVVLLVIVTMLIWQGW